MTKKLKLIIIASVALIVIIAGVIVFKALITPRVSVTGLSGRMILYTTTSPDLGGRCEYVSFSAQADRTDACIDVTSADDAISKLKIENANLNVLNNRMLMKIDADVHTVVESRSPATASPQPQDTDVIIIDKLYSVSLTSVTAY